MFTQCFIVLVSLHQIFTHLRGWLVNYISVHIYKHVLVVLSFKDTYLSHCCELGHILFIRYLLFCLVMHSTITYFIHINHTFIRLQLHLMLCNTVVKGLYTPDLHIHVCAFPKLLPQHLKHKIVQIVQNTVALLFPYS